MQSTSARAHTCAGLQLLARGLEHGGLDPTLIQRIGKDADGRPAIDGGPSFSISHSQSLVACALSDSQLVGLDIEQRRSNISPRLAQRIQRGQGPDSDLDFFDAWCAREAVVKASGRVGLARIQAVGLGSAAHVAQLDDQDWMLARLHLAPDYAGCIASNQPIHAVEVVQISLDPAQ